MSDLRLGDCLVVLRELEDASVDAIVTDPPYGLEFMGKDWDRPWAVSAEARIRFWEEHGDEALEIVRTRERADAVRATVADAGQLDLFAESAS